jgi:hypothetical protein
MANIVNQPAPGRSLFGTEPPNLGCRLVLDFGYFTCDLGYKGNDILDYSFEQLGYDPVLDSYGALANSVTVDLGTFESLELHRDPITGTHDEMRKGHQLKLTLGATVDLFLFNSPIEYIGGATDMYNNYVSHFELFYSLLQDQPPSLLVPYMKGSIATKLPPPAATPLNKNVSCPPLQITMQTPARPNPS